MDTPKQKTCQRCGAVFGCGVDAAGSGGHCWCMDEGFRMPMPKPGESEFTDCFCPKCLREAALAAGLSRAAPGA